MDLADDPMENSLAGAIRCHWKGAQFHTTNASQRASDSDNLGPVALLHQRKRGLEQVQRSESIDGDMFLDDGRVAGSERCKVVADACVGDDKVEVSDSLFYERGDGGGGVGLGFVVDFHNDEFAGRGFGDGGKFFRCELLGITDAGDDGGGGTGEVGLNEAEADAWGLVKRRVLMRVNKREEYSPRLAPVMRTLVDFSPGILIEIEYFLKSLVKRGWSRESTLTVKSDKARQH